LPHQAKSASRTVAVEKVAIAFRADKRWVIAGGTVKFTGVVTKDGVPWEGARIWIRSWYDPSGRVIAEITSGRYGAFSLDHTPPWTYAAYKVPCRDIRFQAEQPETDAVSSPVMVAIAYPTRISISAPDRTPAGASFTVSGKLEYESDEGVWSGLAGKTVKVYYNGVLFGTATTGTDGSYSVRAAIPDPGTYTLKAVFEGEDIPAAAGFAFPPAVAEVAAPDLLMKVLAVAPVMLVATVIAANEIAKPR